MSAKLKRTPYAFGITSWGPLPSTRNMRVQWDGPGSGLYLYPCDPSSAQSAALGMRIRHSSARAEYQTLREAERAVYAFVAAGVAVGCDDESERASSSEPPDRAEVNPSAGGPRDLGRDLEL